MALSGDDLTTIAPGRMAMLRKLQLLAPAASPASSTGAMRPIRLPWRWRAGRRYSKPGDERSSSA
jgi:hypothetical protein